MAYQVRWHLLLFTLVLAATSSLAGTGITYAQEIETDETDEFSGERVVNTSLHQIEHEGFSGRARIFFLYTTNSNTSPYTFVFTVMSRDGWQVLGDDTAEFIVDDGRETRNLTRVDTDTSGGRTSESYAIAFTEDDLRDLGLAEDVRFRVNGNIYRLTNEAKEAAQLIVNRVTGAE